MTSGMKLRFGTCLLVLALSAALAATGCDNKTMNLALGRADTRVTAVNVAGGDKVVVRTTQRWTQTKEVNGIVPSGKPVELAAITIYRVEAGRVKEGWLCNDMLGAWKQIGAVPDMDKVEVTVWD